MGQAVNSALDVRPAMASDKMQRSVYVDFTKEMPFARATSTPFGNPTGTAGDVNTLVTRDAFFQYHVIVGQTILGPARTDAGLDVSQDLVDNDGFEYTLGLEDPADTVIADTAGSSRGTFKVGTDKPFFVSLKFTLADVSGTDDCLLGFRKAEAYNATVDDYDEMAAFNVISGDIKIETILNNAATTTTDTTDNWADAATKTLTVIVDSDGSLYGQPRAVYYEIDGAIPTALPTAVFKFDADELVIPFFHMLHAADVAEATTFVTWESGLYPGAVYNSVNYRSDTAKG